MTKGRIVGAVFAIVLGLLALAAGHWVLDRDVQPTEATTPAGALSSTPAGEDPAAPTHQGFLYGRITTIDGARYQGRLRWGGSQEAFWDDYFNGVKQENPWIAHVPSELLTERHPIEIFGVRIGVREVEKNVGRQFMVRFGEIARIEARADQVRVTLKSGIAFDLDRFDASDFDDGVRVWDGERGVVDLASLRIRMIELLPTARFAAPQRLHGTVQTSHADFTGFVQWNGEDGVGLDRLDGRTRDGQLSVRFDSIRSIARGAGDTTVATLDDGREVVFSNAPEVGDANRGIHVDDPRYGRVQVSWDVFERVDFGPGGSGSAYSDFPPGHPLSGRVTTSDGRRLAGRLVYDLNESETSETLDAPFRGVDYRIPFCLVASILPRSSGEQADAHHAKVMLRDGEELQLERAGDLGDRNSGLLIFVDGQRSEYVPWADVEQVDFDPLPALDPPFGRP
jgi:hypothetical protein